MPNPVMPNIDLILFDVGGVLGTNGWDRHDRAAAVQQFDLDPTEFEDRHQDVLPWWEEGRMTMDEYLDFTVFYEDRPFTRKTFTDYMFAQSTPYPETLSLVRTLRHTGHYRLMTLNNESAELNAYRIKLFGLTDLFDAFLSSCYMGVRKPTPLIYSHAFAIAHASPERTIFIDDRKQNLTPARALGAHTIQYESPDQLRSQLAAFHIL